jgi:osmotically-inducible protein OsmY
MSIRRGKAHADQVLGRVEEIVGQTYADPAAEVHGEALRLRGEVEEDAALQAEQRLEEAATALPGGGGRADLDPARLVSGPEDAGLRAEVVRALMLDPLVPASVEVRVRAGHAVLTGWAEYQFQRDAAEAAARGVVGVADVRNGIELTDTTHVPAGVQRRIRNAFLRKAKLDADRLAVLAAEGTATLSGRVCCQEEHDVAVAAAAAAPGVYAVDDRLTIGLPSEGRP